MIGAVRGPRSRIAAAGLCLAGLLLPRAAAAAEPAGPRSCDVGAYLISLHDFDLARGSFGADLWLWSTCASPRASLAKSELRTTPPAMRSLPTTDRG